VLCSCNNLPAAAEVEVHKEEAAETPPTGSDTLFEVYAQTTINTLLSESLHEFRCPSLAHSVFVLLESLSLLKFIHIHSSHVFYFLPTHCHLSFFELHRVFLLSPQSW